MTRAPGTRRTPPAIVDPGQPPEATSVEPVEPVEPVEGDAVTTLPTTPAEDTWREEDGEAATPTFEAATSLAPPTPADAVGTVSRETFGLSVDVRDDNGALQPDASTPPGLAATPPAAWPDAESREDDVSRETDPPVPTDVSRETAPPVPSDVSRETEPEPHDVPPDGPTPIMTTTSVDDDGGYSGASVDPPPAVSPPAQWPRPPRRRVMTVANQKGGVGKTTSTVNLAVALAQHGIRVLVVDLDPQGNASTAFNLPHTAGTPSIYDVLIGDQTLADVSLAVPGVPHLWCAPATIDLAGAEIELVSVVARESRLRRALDSVGDVDYVLIDCPPSLGLLTLNAMVAANEVLIPIQCEFYALEGLSQLLSNVDLVKNHLNSELFVSTILLTMYDARTRLADQVAAEVRAHFGSLVLSSVIPRSVRVSEAPGFGQTVVTFDPTSRGAVAYTAAAYDLAVRGEAGTPQA